MSLIDLHALVTSMHWHALGKRLHNLPNQPQYLQEHRRRLPEVLFTRFRKLMRRRCVAVVNAREGHASQ